MKSKNKIFAVVDFQKKYQHQVNYILVPVTFNKSKRLIVNRANELSIFLLKQLIYIWIPKIVTYNNNCTDLYCLPNTIHASIALLYIPHTTYYKVKR